MKIRHMLSTLVLVVLVASAVLLHAALMDCHGHDVRVIVIGEKGKGSAEFYSVRGVRDEPSCIMRYASWVKKYAPSLVKTMLALHNDMHISLSTF